ncbi:MAG: class I SAM-dependent methyltransferase [Myxococcota bacterium]
MSRRKDANPFSAVADAYRSSRPEYPSALFEDLAERCARRELAWEAGCGSGQATISLARRFQEVYANDVSDEAVSRAPRHPRVRYVVGAAEKTRLKPHTVDCVLAAQAAHWFDRAAFYSEVRRVGRPGAVIALVGYGLLRIEPSVDQVVDWFYSDLLGAYWPTGRLSVDAEYGDFEFPFEEMTGPELVIVRVWERQQLVDFLSTWSAVVRYGELTGTSALEPLLPRLAVTWPDPEECRTVTWRVFGRYGRLSNQAR